MLRGSKSASCSGFPALSGTNAGEVIGAAGNLLAAKTAPKLPSQRLLPIPLINPPLSAAIRRHSTFRLTSFYIVYFRLSKWDKAPVLTAATGLVKSK